MRAAPARQSSPTTPDAEAGSAAPSLAPRGGAQQDVGALHGSPGGHGVAFGAVTVLNATATGIGCALAVAAGSEADWQWQEGGFTCTAPGADDQLARAVWEILGRRLGAMVRTRSAFPPARGLKTSSSVGAALVQAALRARGEEPDWQRVAGLCVQAARAAQVTLTGAYDDQVAVLRGGAHVTDNGSLRILQSFDVPAWHVAVWVPSASIPKAQVARLAAGGLRDGIEPLRHGLRAESIPQALTANGRVFHRFYKSHGLPVDDRPTQVALEHGALGAGLSGTGPAVAAIFEAPVDLPTVSGGTWTWTRAVPVQP